MLGISMSSRWKYRHFHCVKLKPQLNSLYFSLPSCLSVWRFNAFRNFLSSSDLDLFGNPHLTYMRCIRRNDFASGSPCSVSFQMSLFLQTKTGRMINVAFYLISTCSLRAACIFYFPWYVFVSVLRALVTGLACLASVVSRSHIWKSTLNRF